jgi:hypothetical protein
VGKGLDGQALARLGGNSAVRPQFSQDQGIVVRVADYRHPGEILGGRAQQSNTAYVNLFDCVSQ